MKKLAAIAIAALVAGPAAADDMQAKLDAMTAKADDAMMAREVGQIVGTAEICGYALDADKVAAFVSERLAAMDPMARGWFQTGSGAHKIRLEKLSEIERTAVCATQAKVAAKYGLTP
ncbi:hypothetical protein [Rhizobium rosettiformans]|uniref:hypothetical protein n=1 Tax=Rhizobium rosettiformans TaxID=1368430 RepID=UPI002866B6B6|nr:hypothetical protein [Rhizobium rosettiformans]MDR7027248.1 hypothetical protein [Rhizobium rosettiformans]MDR7065369.1 hypothetical protein [Rhizobium rosettiformans]